MRLVRLLLPILLGFDLGGCADIGREQVGAGEYRITGELRYANDRTLDHDSIRECPAGYFILNEQHSMVAEGPAWQREIECNL
jgi:hypothetical protein